MSDRLPNTVPEMIAWLRAHPDEPFRSSWCGTRLLIGTRSVESICAWECIVTQSDMVPVRRGDGG